MTIKIPIARPYFGEEEKKLVLEFGDTYLKYQQEVPMLIPFTR